MSQGTRILMVDDEASIRLTLSTLLQRAGYDVITAEHGQEAIELLERHSIDLLLVDLKMPGIDGMQVVAAARVRQPDIAIIVLTGHGSMESAIEGLHQGVFDYLLKTTAPPKVIERVQAALAARTQALRQRALLDVVGAAVQELRDTKPTSETAGDAGGGDRRLMIGALALDTWRQEATLHGRTLPLTPTEFRVLLCLAEHAGNMLSYTYIVRYVQGYETSELEASELIKPHIHHLRQKLEPDPGKPQYILNVRGKGYLLSPVGE
jgi:DNA-binding response OmpR family regulator